MWAWRAKLAWALLGPSIVLLIQVEAVLVIADALGALGLRVDAARRTTAIAFAALALVTAAQLTTGLWRRTREARKVLLDHRLDAETRAAVRTELRQATPWYPSPYDLVPGEPPPVGPLTQGGRW